MAIMDRPLRLVVPQSLYETLSEQARDQDRTVSWVVRQALRNHLGVKAGASSGLMRGEDGRS